MPAAAFRLIVRTGPNPGVVIDLTKEVSMMGRDVTNDVVLGDAEISRQHARLTRTPAGFVLEDLGSTNGTFVNGDRLAAPRVLNAGDLLGLGENVTLTFDSTSPESAATMMGAPVGKATAAPPVRAAAFAAPRPAAAAAPALPGVAAPPAEGQKSGSRRWILAGCGCLFLMVACVGLLFFLDAYYPDILYAPLRALGF
ncbi:MAG: FHA domain-containing protein [Anaerolineales bacterium]|nr:FHA domain-containing protein [Anaerolineales bacterium]